MYSGNFIKNRAKRFHTSIFDIHVIDIRYSHFSTDYFANDDNLEYNLFGSGPSASLRLAGGQACPGWGLCALQHSLKSNERMLVIEYIIP